MESSRESLAHLFAGQPWLIAPEHLAACLSIPRQSAHFTLADFITPRQSLSLENGSAHIHITGALAEGAPPIWEKIGNTNYRTLRAELSAAAASGATETHLHINSPGGSVAGIAETASTISALAETMPVHAHCSGIACSAAYWLASAADTIQATASADVGNIGAILVYLDASAFLESLGITLDIFTNEGADLKGTGNGALSDSQREFLQSRIDGIGKDFRSRVEGSREDVSSEVFRAGWYSGQAALDLGLIDTITPVEL